MVKYVLGAGLLLGVAATVFVVGGDRIPAAVERLGLVDRETPGTPQDAAEIRDSIATNTETWRQVKEQGKTTRSAYEERLNEAGRLLDYVRHKQKTLAVAYRDAETNGFPMQWMGQYYERTDAMSQLEALFAEEEHLQRNCDAYRKVVDVAQGHINDAVEKLARNQLREQLIDAGILAQAHEQATRTDRAPGQPDFLEDDETSDPIRSVEELQEEDRRIGEEAARMARLNALLAADGDAANSRGDKESGSTLPSQISLLLGQTETPE